ncbi:MAG: hypothetical protein CENE_02037 [Candidatus Celerinatantimonas neptuna]|nr:MAG: hypothetical protein CENE_02037 [Candidatus Celerinatantimonas neptuna]
MNLLSADYHWLPFRMQDGQVQWLSWGHICDPDVVDFALPRADFQCAAYQMTIGLLQTIFAPEDDEQWGELYHQFPSAEQLQTAFQNVDHAFQVTGDGPLFMQDFDPLSAQKPTTVSGLLIEAPGANGIKNNTDHFIKRGIGDVMSLEMATMALFTLQMNAPSGGQGHRTGLRGGGPLTTLLVENMPEPISLWQRLWLNVMNLDFLGASWQAEPDDLHSGRIFPWLEPTKESSQKNSEIYAKDVHPLHMYWAMPRRIRLIVEAQKAECQISGQPCSLLVKSYRTQNYGGNYGGNWDHPFTPYKWDLKKPEQEHLSIKGQPGGVSYKIWDNLSLSAPQDGFQCAKVVRHFQKIFKEVGLAEYPRLWVSGYDMDNMKARGWYALTLPLFDIGPQIQDEILPRIQRLQKLTNDALWQTRTQIKTALHPKEAKGDLTFIDMDFWHRSEPIFFMAIQQLIDAKDGQLTTEQARQWLFKLRTLCFDLFDEYVLSTELGIGNEHQLHKRMIARIMLKGWFFSRQKTNEIKKFMDDHQIVYQKESSHETEQTNA